MKLKEYMSLTEPGMEITCWDKDVDSEFYFYTPDPKELPDKEFPNVDKCMDRLAAILDVVCIGDNGVNVNLYEKLDHPEVIRIAKEKFFEEYQYEDDSDVVMMLFDDNVTNISQGIEEFSKMMVECLDQAYGQEKSHDVTKNLIQAMAEYGLEYSWCDSDVIDALVELGITYEDFRQAGKEDFVKNYFEDGSDKKPSLADKIQSAELKSSAKAPETPSHGQEPAR